MRFFYLEIYYEYSFVSEKDRSQKIFSLSYINILGSDGTCLQDSTYDLAVYRVRNTFNALLYITLNSLHKFFYICICNFEKS